MRSALETYFQSVFGQRLVQCLVATGKRKFEKRKGQKIYRERNAAVPKASAKKKGKLHKKYINIIRRLWVASGQPRRFFAAVVRVGFFAVAVACFGGFVLSYINTEFCDHVFIGKHLPKSTKHTFFRIFLLFFFFYFLFFARTCFKRNPFLCCKNPETSPRFCKLLRNFANLFENV